MAATTALPVRQRAARARSDRVLNSIPFEEASGPRAPWMFRKCEGRGVGDHVQTMAKEGRTRSHARRRSGGVPAHDVLALPPTLGMVRTASSQQEGDVRWEGDGVLTLPDDGR